MSQSTVVRFGTPLRLPAAWPALLALPDFEDLTTEPAKKPHFVDEVTHRGALAPFRDDHRDVTVVDDLHEVAVTLHSGNGNYWLDVDVMERATGRIVSTSDEPYDTVPSTLEIALRSGDTLEIMVEIMRETA